MARPTKLTKALIAKAKQYDWKRGGEVIPTIEGLSLHLGVARSSVYLWATVSASSEELGVKELAEYTAQRELRQQFSDIVNDYLALQSQLLISNGLRGKFNANITKLILSGKHGYVEKSQQDVTSDGKAIGPVLVKFVGGEPEG